MKYTPLTALSGENITNINCFHTVFQIVMCGCYDVRFALFGVFWQADLSFYREKLTKICSVHFVILQFTVASLLPVNQYPD